MDEFMNSLYIHSTDPLNELLGIVCLCLWSIYESVGSPPYIKGRSVHSFTSFRNNDRWQRAWPRDFYATVENGLREQREKTDNSTLLSVPCIVRVKRRGPEGNYHYT